MFYINARFLSQNLTGVQRFATEISRRIKKTYPDAVFLAPRNILQEELAVELNVRIIGMNTGVLWEQVDLPAYLLRLGKPLLINFCNAAPVYYNNQVVTVHDMAFFSNPKWFSKSFIALYSFMIPRIVRRAKVVLTVSEFSAGELQHYLRVDRSRIKIVDSALSTPPAAETPRNIPPKYILAVGSIDPRKNLASLIAAYLSIDHRDFKLVLVGDRNKIFSGGDDFSRLGDDILFTGRVSDAEMVGWYKFAKAFVFPSLYEGFGLPPLEAMAQNCPTISADIPSCRYVCGNASIFVDPVSVTDIAAAITEVMRNRSLREDLVLRGSMNIRRFSWDACARKVEEAIDHLVE